MLLMKPKRKYNRQPNVITRTYGDMTLIEKRLMYIVINCLDVGRDVEPDLFRNMDFKIPFSELGSTSHSNIKDSIKKLQSRTLTLVDDDKKKEFESLVPFPFVKIKGSVVTLTMLSNVVPFFMELKRGFTQYELAAVLSLKSIYAQKLYELLSRWVDKGRWEVPLQELKKLLNAEKYKWSNFNIRCLSGILEINEKTELYVEFDILKEGKSVTDIIFRITKKLPEEKRVALEIIREEEEIMSKYTPAETKYHVNNFMNKYDFEPWQKDLLMTDDAIREEFIRLDRAIYSGKIVVRTKPTNYIASIIFKDKAPKKI